MKIEDLPMNGGARVLGQEMPNTSGMRRLGVCEEDIPKFREARRPSELVKLSQDNGNLVGDRGLNKRGVVAPRHEVSGAATVERAAVGYCP